MFAPFGTKTVLRFRRTVATPAATTVRFQSSSSSGAKLLQAKTQKMQQQLHKTIQQKQQQGVQSGQGGSAGGVKAGKSQGGNGDGTLASGKTGQPLKLRKGFSTVDKVPSTVNLEPRDVLLDKLYQGYNPLLSPIKPKTKKTSPKILVNIYEDLAFDDDGFENDADSAVIDTLVGPKLQISKYIFDRNPQMEAKLKELDADAKEAKGRREKHDALYERRPAAAGKRGRVRLQYKKNMKKEDDDE